MLIFKNISLSLRFLFRRSLIISSDLVHTKIKDFNYLVNQNDVANYNDAVNNNDNQTIQNDKGKLHPIFFTKISWQIIENLNKFLKTPVDEKILKTIVHRSEHISFFSEIKFPANLIIKSKIWCIKPHKKGAKILIRFDYYSDNKLVAVEYSGGLLFGIKCSGKAKSLGASPETKRINETVIWEKQISIDKLMPYIYAEKTGIDAPIHTNPKFAKSIGLPDIILQGTCTFAKAVNQIINEECDNNLYQITSVSAKFTDMVVVPNEINVRLLKKENKIFKFDVLNKKGKAVIKGGEIIFK